MNKRIYLTALSVMVATLFLGSCKTLNQFADSLNNLQRLEFKLDDVNNFKLAGVNLSNIKSVSDISLMDGIKLTKAFSDKKLPAQFVLNVDAKNPNDGKGGTKQSAATLSSFDWKLYIDDKETIAGNINKEFVIPGTGSSETIPLVMNIDLYEFFGNKGYEDMINLALAIGGQSGSAARLKLDARPTVKTPLGNINYPNRITIVDKGWTN
ncbi:MAG: hypothetical protein CVV25_07640 [Ignavibacteriae bacterium HGW-Ignavibacteriae-4]|jgi:hypothetical protein|nr:MAG: hypothetical protein CVV25_07640 [Ignavibacteriae bacterium HGW-Ignavibacteriae-4]